MNLRILFVENDPMRETRVQEWLSENANIRLSRIPIGNIAITMIEKDLPRDWDGIMLDHDLNEMRRDIPYKSGWDVVKAMVRRTHKDTPIMIHSMNPAGSAKMRTLLEEEGFSNVTKIHNHDHAGSESILHCIRRWNIYQAPEIDSFSL